MSSPASLDIIAATSLTFGDITVLAQQSYLSYTIANPSDNSNKWTVILPAVRDQGIVAWRVRYPLDPSIPMNTFGWTAVQTTLCNYATGATVIDYDPMKLVSSPQLSSKPVFISAFWWGASDRTVAVQSLLAQNQNSTTFTFNLSQLGPPPSGSSSITSLFMVYGYVVTDSTASPPTQKLLLGSYFGRQSNPSVSIKTEAPPTLDVLGAFYGFSDVSNALTSFTTAQQTIILDLSKLKNYFQTYIKPGDDGPTKVLSILYRYHGQDMKLWASTATTGSLTISPDVQPTSTPNLCRRQRAGESNLLGLVWGDGTAVSLPNPQWPLAEVYSTKIFASMTFTPTSAFFDGLSPGSVNTCHVYYQYGISGDVQTVAGTTTQQIALVPRNPRAFDPPAARGLLRPDVSSPCFILRTASALPFGTQSVPSNSTWQLVCSGTQTSVPFMVVPANTVSDSNLPFAMLKIYIASIQKWAYLGLPTNSSWSTLDGQPASFMVPGQRCSNNPGDWALAFNYEIPSRNDAAGLMFGVSQYQGPKQAPYNSSFLIMHQHGSVATVMLMSLQMALHYLPGTTFEPKFTPNPVATLSTTDAMIALNATASIMDSCFVQTLSVAKTLSWDLLCTVCGLWSLKNPFEWAEKLAKWWTNLGSIQRAGVLTALQALQSLMHEIIETSGNISNSETVHAGLSLITSFYSNGILWSLGKSMTSNLNWWTVGKVILNIVAVAVDIIQPQNYLVQQLVAVAVWVTDAVTNMMGWIKQCLPSAGINAVHATRLISQMKAAGKTAKMLALSRVDRTKVMMALTAPIVYQLQSQIPAIGAPHPLTSHMAALKSDAGLQQQHLDHPFVEMFSDVPLDARNVAAELADTFTIDKLPTDTAGNCDKMLHVGFRSQ